MTQKSGTGILFVLCCASLTGCMDVATTGAQAVYNRHSLQNKLSDQYVSIQAYQILHDHNQEFKNTNISISTYNGEVLLAGQVPKAEQKVRIGKLMHGIENVERVYNLLEVQPPSSSLVQMSDAWITTKVKSKLFASNDVDATKVKVITENGTVYLMGILKPDEADAAVDVASNTDGVVKVVKIFSYMKISKKPA